MALQTMSSGIRRTDVPPFSLANPLYCLAIPSQILQDKRHLPQQPTV